METNPRRWIRVLRGAQDRLASFVEPLTPEQLRGPSYHSWSIAQVLGHIGSQAEIFMGWIDAAVDGTEPAGQETMQPIWDAWDARNPDDQARDSVAYNERVVRRFEALTEDELERMDLNLFGMELDAAGLARIRLPEMALHTWDIEVALNPAANVAPDSVGLLIDTQGFLAGLIGKPQGKAFRLLVRTSGPERQLSLRVGDAVELTEWEEGEADAEMHIPAEAFLRLVYGRLDPEHAPEVEVSGPVSLDELRRIFPGV